MDRRAARVSARAISAAAAVPAAAWVAGCGDPGAEERRRTAAAESLAAVRAADSAAAAARAESLAAVRERVAYRAQPIAEGQETIQELRTELGDDGFLLFLRANRVDLGHVRAGDTLAVPVTPLVRDSSFSAYAPFPAALVGAGLPPKLILISLRVQALAAYEHGRLVHWAATSSGRRTSPTPPGLYHTNWKSRRRVSTVDDAWILEWAFNIHSRNGISIHKYDLPGYPASHSCVRLLEEDAQWLYGWAEQWRLSDDGRVLRDGTPVVIFGEYDWDGTPPWRRLAEDPQATSVPLEEIDDALRRHLPSEPPVAAAEPAPAGGQEAAGTTF
jgi:lipoprotein-anchoring transpeptidase ErfK/SrfK